LKKIKFESSGKYQLYRPVSFTSTIRYWTRRFGCL